MHMHALYSAESLYGSLLVQDAVSQSIQVTFSKEIRVPCRHTFQGRPTIRPSWPTAYRYGQRFDGHPVSYKLLSVVCLQFPFSRWSSNPGLSVGCALRTAQPSAPQVYSCPGLVNVSTEELHGVLLWHLSGVPPPSGDRS